MDNFNIRRQPKKPQKEELNMSVSPYVIVTAGSWHLSLLQMERELPREKYPNVESQRTMDLMRVKSRSLKYI